MEAANYNDDAVLYSSYNLTLQDGILYQPLFHEKFHPAKCESRKVPILVSARSKKSQSKTRKKFLEIFTALFGMLSYIISEKAPITAFHENRDRCSQICRAFISFLPIRIKSRKFNWYLKYLTNMNATKSRVQKSA